MPCLCAVAAWIVPVGMQAQDVGSEAGKPASPYDYAEIYVDRYFESSEPDLSAAGERKSQALALYTRGLTLERQGDDAGAAEVFSEVLEILPGEIDLSRRVAYLLAQIGETDKARAALQEFLDNNPDRPAAYLNLSEFIATFFSGDQRARNDAIGIAEQAEKRFPNSAAVYRHLVKLYQMARRRDDAEAAVERGLARDVRTANYWMQMAEVAMQLWPPLPGNAADLERINAVYEKAMRFGAGNLALEIEIADFYHGSRQLDKARDLFLDILERHPESLEARNSLAEVYAALGDADMVLATLQELAQINPNDLTAQKRLARIYLTQAQQLSTQIAADPSKMELFEEKLDGVIEHYLNAFAIAKGDPAEYLQVADLMMRRRRADEAVGMLERAVFYYPDSPELIRELAYACSSADRHEEALTHFEKTVALTAQENPDSLDAEFYFQFGAAAEQSEDYERAEKLFKRSMKLLSDQDISDERNEWLAATLYNYLGYMWLERDRNIDEAGELIRTAYDLNPDSGAIADSMGWFYFKKGRYQEAMVELLKAEELMGEPDPVVYDHLAQTAFELGDKAKALDYMEKAIELDPENEEFIARLEEFKTREVPAAPGSESESGPADPPAGEGGDDSPASDKAPGEPAPPAPARAA